MYADSKPCQVCGSPVRLEAHTPVRDEGDGPRGPKGGVVGTGDPTTDDRICTNADCPSNGTGSTTPTP